jgi:hypothetical protein
MDIREQQLELSEGLEVVLYLDDWHEWMLADATVDGFNPQGHHGATYEPMDRSPLGISTNTAAPRLGLSGHYHFLMTRK